MKRLILIQFIISLSIFSFSQDMLEKYQKAEKYYSHVLKMVRPGRTIYNQALENLGQLAYAQGKKKKAFRLIKQAVKYKRKTKGSISVFADYPLTLAKLALLYEEFGKKDKAVITWQEVYRIGGTETRRQAQEHLQVLRIKW